MRFIRAFIACGLWAAFIIAVERGPRVTTDDTALLTLSIVVAGALAGGGDKNA